MSDRVIAFLIVGSFIALVLWLPISVRRTQRKCDQRNVASADACRNWDALTADDREWLLANGAEEPTLSHWEVR